MTLGRSGTDGVSPVDQPILVKWFQPFEARWSARQFHDFVIRAIEVERSRVVFYMAPDTPIGSVVGRPLLERPNQLPFP
jgi:hypothetical protein